MDLSNALVGVFSHLCRLWPHGSRYPDRPGVLCGLCIRVYPPVPGDVGRSGPHHHQALQQAGQEDGQVQESQSREDYKVTQVSHRCNYS